MTEDGSLNFLKKWVGEARVRGVLVDAVKEVKELEDKLAQAKKIIRSLISSVLIKWGDDIGEAREFLDKLEEE